MPSPRPKPTAVKKLEGTYRKDRAAKAEPQPLAGIPEPPKYLSRLEKKAYRDVAKQLDAMGVLTVADGAALELMAQSYGIIRKCYEYMDTNGMAYVVLNAQGSKERRVMAEMRISQAERKELRMLLQEFGLTPSARSKVEMVRAVEEDDYEAFLNSETVKRKVGNG